MRKEKALEALDRIEEEGYTVSVTSVDLGEHVIPDGEGGFRSKDYQVKVAQIHFDRVDLRALCDLGDDLDLEVMIGPMEQGSILFTEPDRRPEAIRTQRRRPRAKLDRRRVGNGD